MNTPETPPVLEIFPWNEHFRTGNDTIDNQHRMLVDLLNRLASRVAFGDLQGHLSGILDELTDYTVYHFESEEAIWAETLQGSEDEVRHKAVHDQFITMVERLKAEQAVKPTEALIQDTLAFLARWLASHILESDKRMAFTVEGLRQGMTAEQAKQHADERMSGETRALIDLILSIYGTLASNTVQLMHEINENRQARQALEASEQRYRAVADATPVPMAMNDEKGSVIFLNDAFTRAYGYTHSDIPTLDDWWPLAYPDPDYRRWVAAAWQERVAKAGRGFHDFEPLEVELRTKDGGKRTVLAAAAALPGTDERVHLVTLYDITARKEIENALKQHQDKLEIMVQQRTVDLEIAKEAAEAASRAKTAFLSIASHELRTPMHGVMGMIGLAQRKSENPVVQGYLSVAARASQQLLGVINDVLDISRIESDKLTLDKAAFTLAELRNRVIDATGFVATEKNLTLDYPPNPAIEKLVFQGDLMRLGQVLINLVSNAIKFTQAGSVAVDVRVTPDSTGQRSRLHIQVKDTGIGILPADQKRIFQAFEQVDSSASRKYGGTGLGLALCRRLVEAMGGTIGVSSEPDRGSLFWFTLDLPMTTESSCPESEVSAETELQACFGGANVLVVDDEPINRSILEELLAAVGLKAFTADDGTEALALAQAARFDLILMDVIMPVMDGVEATRRLRQLPAYAETPIIAVTANAFSEDREECLEAGMTDHLGKPIAPEDLYRVVLKCLKRNQGIPDA